MPTLRAVRSRQPGTAGRRTWLEARDYRVVEMGVADVERDLETELGRLEASVLEQR